MRSRPRSNRGFRRHDRQGRAHRRRVARAAGARAVRDPARQGNRARVHGHVLGRALAGRLSLCGLRDRALPLGHEVRVRERVAELLRADDARQRRHREPTRATGWSARRSCAQPAVVISATSSTTARRRRVCGTASTPVHSTSSARPDGRAVDELGLFPLGLVLLPTERLPLHIFEERYKELVGSASSRTPSSASSTRTATESATSGREHGSRRCSRVSRTAA